MRSRTIAEDEILTLSKKEESHFFDRKAVGVSGKKAQKIAVAFANADGGEFIVGISDDKDEPDPAKRWHGTTICLAPNKEGQKSCRTIQIEKVCGPEISGYTLVMAGDRKFFSKL